jgi:hypothetical protein
MRIETPEGRAAARILDCRHDTASSRGNRAVKEYAIKTDGPRRVNTWRCADCYATIPFTDDEIRAMASPSSRAEPCGGDAMV